MHYIKVTLDINEDTKKYKGWYYNNINGEYYIFKPEPMTMSYIRYTLKDCKRCIDRLVEEGE